MAPAFNPYTVETAGLLLEASGTFLGLFFVAIAGSLGAVRLVRWWFDR